MAAKHRDLVRYAVIAKDSGKVIKTKNMRHGYTPMVDPERYEALKVSGSVEPGMIRNGESFAWPR